MEIKQGTKVKVTVSKDLFNAGDYAYMEDYKGEHRDSYVVTTHEGAMNLKCNTKGTWLDRHEYEVVSDTSKEEALAKIKELEQYIKGLDKPVEPEKPKLTEIQEIEGYVKILINRDPVLESIYRWENYMKIENNNLMLKLPHSNQKWTLAVWNLVKELMKVYPQAYPIHDSSQESDYVYVCLRAYRD